MNDNIVGAFFALLRAGLWDDATLNLDDKLDWEGVYQLAEEQSVIGVVLAGIEHSNVKPPQELLLQWIGQVQLLEQQNKAMNQFVADLIENMRTADIYAILVKGQGIAQCYERPLWRSCGDVDFFLSEDNYQKAKDYLISLANKVDPEGEYSKHLGMTIDPWFVELHGSLQCGLSGRVDKGLNEISDDMIYGGNVRSWINGNTQVFIPGVDNDIIYVFTHILNHFYKGGIGLRQICDWCRLLWTYRDKIDRTKLEKRLNRAQLMTAWKAFAVFAVDYLGLTSEAMPLYDSSAKWHRKANKICKFVMEVGNFGHNRDMSYYIKYPYFIRKCKSLGRRCGDLWRLASIFPVDSFRFFPRIMYYGLRSAARGE